MVWGKLSDACFVYRVTKDKKSGNGGSRPQKYTGFKIMNYFIKEKEFARFKNRVPGSLPDRLYHVLKERTYYNTREDKLVQSTDTQEWYHLVWERMSDASFVYYVEKDEKLGKWVHDRTMEIV